MKHNQFEGRTRATQGVARKFRYELWTDEDGTELKSEAGIGAAWRAQEIVEAAVASMSDVWTLPEGVPTTKSVKLAATRTEA